MNQFYEFKTIYKFIFLLIISFLLSFNITLKSEAILKDEIARLQNGEIISKSLTKQLKGSLKGAEAKIFINAPPQKVWEIIGDQESLPRYVTRFKQVKILEKNPNSQKVKLSVKFCPFLPLFNYTLLFNTVEKYKQLKFKKIDGSFKELYGFYELKPYQNGTILSYRIYLDPGFYIPDFVRSDGVTKDLPEILESVRSRVEKN